MWIVPFGFGTGKGAVQCEWHIYYGSPHVFNSDLVMFLTSYFHLDKSAVPHGDPWAETGELIIWKGQKIKDSIAIC